MGLGETQVFQDEKSRLANTTVARIVAAKVRVRAPNTGQEMTVIVPAGVGADAASWHDPYAIAATLRTQVPAASSSYRSRRRRRRAGRSTHTWHPATAAE